MIGLSGAGKTATAPLLARRLEAAAEDLDASIEREAGRSVPELIRAEGEDAFRVLEHRSLLAVLGRPEPALVIACGGGVVTHAGSRAALRGGCTVVWLRVRPEVAAGRLGGAGAATRPLLEGSDVAGRLALLLDAREPLYREAADIEIDTDGLTPQGAADAVADALRARWAGSGS